MKTLSKTLALALLLRLSLSQTSQAAEVGNNNPTGITGEYNGSVTTAGSYDPYTGNAKRFIDDLTVTGSVGAYPLKWTRIFNSRRGTGQFGNGGGWTHSYQWGLAIWPPWFNCGPELPDVTVYYPDGRTMELWWEEAQQSYVRRDGGEPGDRLEKGVGINDYNLKLQDGGIVQFRNENNKPVCKYIVDPYGQVTTLLRDASHRLSTITEPAGRYLEISYFTYSLGQSALDVIDYVKAYDGLGHLMETVDYSYSIVNVNGIPRFVKLDYANYDDGNHATYGYYPTTSYPGLGPPKLQTCDDVRFAGAMSKIEYDYVNQTNDVACPIAWGQIKAEKNLMTGVAVSSVDYPSHTSCTPDSLLKRTEKRADDATRLFEYGQGGELESYTDFAYSGQAHHTTRITYAYADPSAPNDHYFRVVTDARPVTPERPHAYTTTTEKEGKTGAVIAVIHDNGSRIKYTYTDPNNPYYVAFKTDENDKTTYYDRLTEGPNRHRVWQIRYPDGGVEQFTYNTFGQVLTHLMTSGGLETFSYDTRGLKLFYTPPYTQSDAVPGNHPTMYTYYDANNCQGRFDLIDRLKSVRDPRQYTTTYDYNKRGQVTRVTHPPGSNGIAPYTESSYNLDGTLQWSEDENRNRTTYLYDEYKRIILVRNPLLKETINSYEPWNGHGALSHTTTSVYLTTLPSLKQIKYDYDSNFRLIQKTQAPGTLDEATTTYGYDEVGNQITVTEPRGQPGAYSNGAHSTSAYDDRNRRISVTDALDHKTSWIYDDVGNMLRETRADLKFRTWDEYDEMNRIKRTTGFLGAADQTNYEYDDAGNLQRMTDSKGAIYEYTYDALNRKESATYPVDAASPPTARSEEWRYDAAGNLRAYKNPANQWKHFVYDERNRQTESYWNTTEVGTAYDLAIGDRTVTGVDAASRVLNITAYNLIDSTYVEYSYDPANHKTGEIQRIGNVTSDGRSVETFPDDDGNRRTLKVDGAYSLTYDYTQRQQLAHINKKVTAHVENQFFKYRYDKNGNLLMRQNVLQGNDATFFDYDKVNRVTWCVQTTRDQAGQDVAFSASNYDDYDDLNRLQSIARREDEWQGERFEYDYANQLESVSYRVPVGQRPLPTPDPDHPAIDLALLGPMQEVDRDWNREALAALQPDPVREPLASMGAGDPDPDAQFGGPRTVTYTNDPINRLSMSDSNGIVTNYTPNGLNQYTAVSDHPTPVYDANFNLSGYGGWTYVYDADKRLIAANGNGHETRFLYDGLGRCVRRTIDGAVTVFTYDEWKPIVEWNDAGQFVAWNLYGPGPDEILVRYQPDTGGGGNYIHVHYHLDAMGNVQFLLSEANLGLEKYTYDAFGQPRITGWNNDYRAVSAYGNRFLFTGREYIYTLRLYDYRHRFYHPGLGRFIQTDPIGFKGDPVNLYRYCRGNPIGHSDPTGLQPGKDEILDKPNLTMFGQGDWMRAGSPFTNGEMLSKAKNYVGEVKSAVNKAVDKANKGSRNVQWSASFSNWLKEKEYFQSPRTIATTTWGADATAVMNTGAVASFNVNLQININWNAGRSASFGSALRTDVFGLWKTGEIEHSRDALRALTSPYGGARSAVGIANEQAAGMVGQSIPEGAASSRMNAALMPWADATMNQSRLDHDQFGGDHIY